MLADPAERAFGRTVRGKELAATYSRLAVTVGVAANGVVNVMR
jgi:hypothetical protein